MAARSAWLKLCPLSVTATTAVRRLPLRRPLPLSPQPLPFHRSAGPPQRGAGPPQRGAGPPQRGAGPPEDGAAGSKEQLQWLRRRTGLPFSACRAALNKFQGDGGKAEEWLQGEAHRLGLAKATKLEGRSTQNGILGVMHGERSAALVEVACETDFVSRSDVFQRLVEITVGALSAHGDSCTECHTQCYTRLDLSGEEILRLISPDTKSTLAEVLALTVGRLGERVVIQRGCWLGVPTGSLITSYVHGAPPPPPPPHAGPGSVTLLGKFAALVVLRPHTVEAAPGGVEGVQRVEEFGRRLAQHVVGMAPLSLGERRSVEREGGGVDGGGDGGDVGDGGDGVAAETELMSQAYLLDPAFSVQQKLDNAGVQIIDFVRYESGETLIPSSQSQ